MNIELENKKILNALNECKVLKIKLMEEYEPCFINQNIDQNINQEEAYLLLLNNETKIEFFSSENKSNYFFKNDNYIYDKNLLFFDNEIIKVCSNLISNKNIIIDTSEQKGGIFCIELSKIFKEAYFYYISSDRMLTYQIGGNIYINNILNIDAGTFNLIDSENNCIIENSRTLDSFNFFNVSLIKIKGAESDINIFKGAAKILDVNQPFIVFQNTDIFIEDKFYTNLKLFLMKHGYRFIKFKNYFTISCHVSKLNFFYDYFIINGGILEENKYL